MIILPPRIHTLKPAQTTAEKVMTKIALVALACFAFFQCQIILGTTLASKVTVFLMTTTALCELLFPKTHSHWVQKDLTASKLSCFVLLYHFCFLIKTLLLKQTMAQVPLQEIAKLIAQKNLKMIFTSILVAPFAEEILFRGYLFERSLDFIACINRKFHLVDAQTVMTYANIVQAALFGSLHILFHQVHGPLEKLIVFLDTFLMGALLGEVKLHDKNLFYCMINHGFNNLTATISLLKP